MPEHRPAAVAGAPLPRALRGLLVLLVLTLLTTLVAPGPAARAASPGTEQGLLTRLAGERDRAGVGTLRSAPDLASVARRHAEAMAGRARVFHDAAVREEVTGWSLLGENVGAGPDAASLHSAFTADAPSRQTLLDPRWQEVGIGAASAPDGTVYVTALFRVPDATPTGTATPSGPTAGSGPTAASGPTVASGPTAAPSRPGTAAPASTPSGVTTASPAPTSTTSGPDGQVRVLRMAPLRSLPAPPAGADLATRVDMVRAATVPTTDPVAGALAWAARIALLSPAG